MVDTNKGHWVSRVVLMATLATYLALPGRFNSSWRSLTTTLGGRVL